MAWLKVLWLAVKVLWLVVKLLEEVRDNFP
jgi:hypothetical protein